MTFLFYLLLPLAVVFHSVILVRESAFSSLELQAGDWKLLAIHTHTSHSHSENGANPRQIVPNAHRVSGHNTINISNLSNKTATKTGGTPSM
jgi:hypothetical protein